MDEHVKSRRLLLDVRELVTVSWNSDSCYSIAWMKTIKFFPWILGQTTFYFMNK